MGGADALPRPKTRPHTAGKPHVESLRGRPVMDVPNAIQDPGALPIRKHILTDVAKYNLLDAAPLITLFQFSAFDDTRKVIWLHGGW